MTDTPPSNTDPKPAWRVTIEAPNTPDNKPVVLEPTYRQHSTLSDKHPAMVINSRLLADGSILYELVLIVEGPSMEPEKLKGLTLVSRETAERMIDSPLLGLAPRGQQDHTNFLIYGDADE